MIHTGVIQREKRIPAAEISHFKVAKQFYINEDQQAENTVLFVFTAAGERRVLCGAPDQMLIRSLAGDCSTTPESPLDESMAES